MDKQSGESEGAEVAGKGVIGTHIHTKFRVF